MDLARTRRIVGRGLRLRCPRCGQGRLFEGPFRMGARCPVCGLVFEREAGYFVGAIYLNYGMTTVLTIGGYFLLDAWLAPSVATQLVVWGTVAVAFPLWFFRYSKGLWLSLDYLVDPIDTQPNA
jgi:uncharacterized protein (DUF983 family)